MTYCHGVQIFALLKKVPKNFLATFFRIRKFRSKKARFFGIRNFYLFFFSICSPCARIIRADSYAGVLNLRRAFTFGRSSSICFLLRYLFILTNPLLLLRKLHIFHVVFPVLHMWKIYPCYSSSNLTSYSCISQPLSSMFDTEAA